MTDSHGMRNCLSPLGSEIKQLTHTSRFHFCREQVMSVTLLLAEPKSKIHCFLVPLPEIHRVAGGQAGLAGLGPWVPDSGRVLECGHSHSWWSGPIQDKKLQVLWIQKVPLTKPHPPWMSPGAGARPRCPLNMSDIPALERGA